MSVRSNSGRSLAFSIPIALLALVVGYFVMYEPAKRASLLPFVANKDLSYAIYAMSYLALWTLVWRYRHKYWPPPEGGSRALQALVITFLVAVFPLFVGAWFATWPVWYTRYFGSPAQLKPHTVLAFENLRKFRTPYVQIKLEAESGATLSMEWAIEANPTLPRINRDWLGKKVCPEGKTSYAGFVIKQMRECAVR